MGTRKTAGYLTRAATYATNRHNYQHPGPSTSTPIAQRPRSTVFYTPLFEPSPIVFEINAPVNSIVYMVGSALPDLGLSAVAPQGGDAVKPPRGFRPSKIHAQFREKTGSRQVALGSQRPYNYYASSQGPYQQRPTQISYSAPICALDRTPATLLTNFQNMVTVLRPKATPTQGLLIRLTEESMPDTADVEP